MSSLRALNHTRTHPYAQVHTYGLYLANQNDVDLAVSGEGSFSTYVNGVERRQQILTVNVSGPIPPSISLQVFLCVDLIPGPIAFVCVRAR